ncbi:MAG: hypothetical protein RIB98_11815 [Acidimicrobiales bacterium]
MRRHHPALQPTPWRAADRPRVLIEHHDWAIATAVGNLLVAEGYEVSSCGGPNDRRHHECPLARGGDCDRADEADIVFFGLNIADEDDRAVLLAWRDRHPEVPVVVELPVSRIPLYQDELEGCLTVPQPMTRETLLDAVNRARTVGGYR